MKHKTIWRVLLLIGILSLGTLLVATSCKKEVDKIKTIDYIYKNSSGKDLELLVFNSNKIQIKSYTILNGGQITSHTTKSETVGLFQYEDNINMIGDSVLIKFSDNRCIGYSKSVQDDIFNVKKYDNYSEDLIAQSSFSLIYSITVDAYNSSAVCGK
ncbi:MAG: hypothetical protein PHP31_07240 [Lentimicrobiaceae bacterium]|nr:hypothetical protein [Lentimicrobiaceae bacterium]